MSEKTETFWNGEPCVAVRAVATVEDAPEFPEYWARELIGERRRVVWVRYGDQEFFIDNEDDEGWKKVTEGQGGPRFTHKNLSVSNLEIETDGGNQNV